MDKWKEMEINKMKAGGNRKARDFFEDHDDWHPKASLSERFNSKAAALYRDKIATEAAGKTWSEEKSSASGYVSSVIPKSATTGNLNSSSNGSARPKKVASTVAGNNDWSQDTYQGGADMDHIKREKEDFFSRRQNENATRPE